MLVFTLVTVYGGQRRSSCAEDESRRRFSESYPLLDRQPLLADEDSVVLEKHGSASDDEGEQAAAAASSDDEVDTATPRKELNERLLHSVRGTPSEVSEGPRSPGWPLQDDPYLVATDTKQAVKRPIVVFPGRLLDLCNPCAPLTFLAFLPNGSQERSKWLAHGRHSEVFQVASLVRRTVLKIIPIIGEFSEQQVGAIAAAIEGCFQLSSLRHGTRYRTPNFIEVERIACVFDQFPEWLLRSDRGLGSKESPATSLASEMAAAGSPEASDLLAAFRRWKGTNQCCLTRHFIVFEQHYAGKPLSRITLRSAVQGRSLFVQASCSVAVAERALGFRLTGVDCDKLLVAVTDAASLEYRLMGRVPLSVDCAGLKAHLAGAMSFAFDAGTVPLDSLLCLQR
ncbi:serine/threonine-protein kinase haspin-like [Amblyomma americanum]